ncbi:MAG: SRPBCC family protein [Nevskiales bacterium]|nr:SRPBCC family protein [Nevskiales bacterium]
MTTLGLRGALALVAVLLGMPAAHAATVDRLDIERVGERYRMALSARLDSPADMSFAVFRDYRNLPRINDAVERVELRDGAAPGAQRLYTRIRICALSFCKHLDQVQDMKTSQSGAAHRVIAQVLPEFSNLRFGQAEWTLRACDGERTCLHFESELEPDFWVPPLIGPWLIRRTMQREALQTARGIERLAGGDLP